MAIVIGTRPEAIKLAPVVEAVRNAPPLVPFVISTGQHREMLEQVFSWFQLSPDLDLQLMRPDQGLSALLGMAVSRLDEAFASEAPDAVLVQGDTTTALSAALASFHRRIPVGHVEAGLRTYDLAAPFPEEANRALISRIATWHFAPTERSVQALHEERVPGEVIMTGNTVVDALLHTAALERKLPVELSGEQLVLITGHRRENFGSRFGDAFSAIGELAAAYPKVDFVYPVHLNPMVREHAHRVLSGRLNVQLIAPLPYPDLIALMKRSYLILTDSGGIQEEAPSLGVPVLIMRDTTERPEAVTAGVAKLVGTDRDAIIQAVSALLDDKAGRARYAEMTNPFGDGHASERIARHLQGALIPSATR